MHKLQSPSGTRKNSRRGSALLLSVLVLFVFMSLSASFLSVTLFQNSTARGAQESERAHTVAESGADRAIFELQVNADFDGDGIGNTTGTVGNTPYTVTIEPAFAEYTRPSFANGARPVAEDFSYASDTNDEWLSDGELLAMLESKGA